MLNPKMATERTAIGSEKAGLFVTLPRETAPGGAGQSWA